MNIENYLRFVFRFFFRFLFAVEKWYWIYHSLLYPLLSVGPRRHLWWECDKESQKQQQTLSINEWKWAPAFTKMHRIESVCPKLLWCDVANVERRHFSINIKKLENILGIYISKVEFSWIQIQLLHSLKWFVCQHFDIWMNCLCKVYPRARHRTSSEGMPNLNNTYIIVNARTE